VVSVTATLADGQPLPGWLHFDNDTGQFAGLVPDDLTGSIDHDGGFDNGQGGPELMTVEVVARDSKGNLAVTDFTIDLSTPTPHKGEKHGWNVLPLGPHREIAPLHAMDRPMDHVLWHGVPALDTDRVHVHATHHGRRPGAGRSRRLQRPDQVPWLARRGRPADGAARQSAARRSGVAVRAHRSAAG